MTIQKKGLGSKGLGLEALLNNKINELNENIKMIEIDINYIEPNKNQPRETFEEKTLDELSQSIKQYGILQPIIVKKNGNNNYQIIAGERRWRASKIAGIKKIPAIIKDVDEIESFEASLIENIQRENLNAIEEAKSYKMLIDKFSLNQEDVAKRVNKSRSVITNSLRLLNLDYRVQKFVIENKITSGHARAILGISDNEKQFYIANKIIDEKLSVRDTENIIKNIQKVKPNKNKNNFDTDNYKYIENELKTILGTKVKLSNNKNKGKIEIEYYSNEDLDRLISMIKCINY